MANHGPSGERIRRLEKEREVLRSHMDQVRDQIKEDNKTTGFKEKFGSSQADLMEAEFRSGTVGLKTKEDFMKMRETLEKKEALLDNLRKEAEHDRKEKEEAERRKNRKSKVLNSKLSFSMGEDEEEEGGGGDGGGGGDKDDNNDNNNKDGEGEEGGGGAAKKKMKIMKNPNVDTSFLRDRDRERAEFREEERLMEEFHQRQQMLLAQKIQVEVNYWDGAPNIQTITCTRGTTISKFLRLVSAQLSEAVREIRNVPTDNLIYAKQDVVLPHDLTFHYLIEKKAFGPKGIIFDLANHSDIRIFQENNNNNAGNNDELVPLTPAQQLTRDGAKGAEAAAKKDVSVVACGKVVEAKWFERHKHIFPMNKWTTFDPMNV